MDNDHVNSAENQSVSDNSTSDNPPASEKPPRSKVERIVVWSLIGLLAIFAAVEAQSQIGYRKTLEAFESANDKNEETLTLGLFESKLKKCLAIKTNGTKDEQSTILYKWPSLLRNYEIHFTLIPGEDQLLASYATHNSPAAMIGQPNQENDLVNDPGPEEGDAPGGRGDEGDSAAASGERERGGRRE